MNTELDENGLLHIILNTLLDGVIIIDDKGIIQSFNKAASRIFGYASEEVIGTNVKILLPEPYWSSQDSYIRNYLTTGERKVVGNGKEAFVRKKDGSMFPMDMGINEMWIGGERKFVGTIRDISERSGLMQQLISSNTELERFAYVASHDLQEPIRMINNFGKLLLSEYSDVLDKEGREYLSMVTDSGERMRDVVNDLLEYSRIGNENVRFAAFEGEIALMGALENLKTLIDEQHAVITHDPMPELYGNPIQIMRLLQNLIANAIKYQPKGGIPVIHVGVEDDKETYAIAVKDNGLGIDNTFLKQIFEPFRRLHTWDHIKGSGLGLAICKKIVENNNGVLDVKSVPGEGSVFTTRLPKRPALKETA